MPASENQTWQIPSTERLRFANMRNEDAMVDTNGHLISKSAASDRDREVLPHLEPAETGDVARITRVLVGAFRPERIYVFGSQARGTISRHSDVDLLVVVEDAGQYPHHLGQEAHRVVGNRVLPLDIVFMSRDKFDGRVDVVASLPATVSREGKLLYASVTA